MNPVRKRLKLGPDATVSSAASNDALLLLLPPPAAPGYGGAEVGAEEEVEEGYLLVEEDTTDSSLVITMEDSQKEVKAVRRRVTRKRRRKMTENEEDEGEEDGPSDSEDDGEAGVVAEIDKQLDQSLETKSKQLNLTTVNVRNILHEVITNEHVVAMMKAAINETDAVPPFEPKMTRSKFKEVVEKGVVIPAWNISPIKKTSDINKAPQFVDILLAEEDSSDEEYHPDEEEEDETAEDTFHESDMESTASSPRGSRLHKVDDNSCSPWQTSRTRSRRIRAKSVTMGPPPPPPSKAPLPKAVPDSTFLEKLHAVEEELAVCMEPFQPLPESGDEVGLMAYRTRSKRPLRDVPMGKLEAELRAPDITPDMYDASSTHEDREWTDWLRGLMSSEMDNEEECDDEDDPEYNFLAEVDEPDKEDYRDDKAVRITKKEVNELMEELFETLKEDLAGQELEETHEEEEEPQEEIHTVQIPPPEEQPILQPHNEEAVNEPITEMRTVKQQLALLRSRQKLGLPISQTYSPEPHTLKVDVQQRKRLQLQLQQHVQLLTQIHLLSAPVAKLHSEAETTRQFLFELDLLARRGELLMSSSHPGFCSSFRASNLQAALQLLEELRQEPITYLPQKHIPDARGNMRCFPVMPAEVSWLFATRPVFLYPELLPCASLDPALYCRRRTAAFTAAEDCLLVLGLRNMEGSCDPTKLVSQFLLRKTLVQVRRRILQCCRPGSPDNIVKAFRYQRVLWPMQVACRQVNAAECRPPVEREEGLMPLWLARSLPIIHSAIGGPSDSAPKARNPSRCGRVRQSQLTFLRSVSSTYTFPNGLSYPLRLPSNLDFRRIGFILLQPPTPAPDPPSSPLADEQMSPSSSWPSSPDAHSPLQPALQRLALEPDITAPTVSKATREQITSHFRTLAGLRRRTVANSREKSDLEVGGVSKQPTPCAPESPASSQMEVQESDDVVTADEEEEEEEESEMQLFLSDSSPSSVAPDNNPPDPEEVESESEQDGTLTPSQRAEEDDHGGTSSDESAASVLQLQAKPPAEATEEENDDEDNRESEDEAFARDYLLRVWNAVQLSPACAEQLEHTLDGFSSKGAPEDLFDRLSCVLQPWPQLLKDFAAFLNQDQARRCGLLVEQQMFERSRRFLQRLAQSLGEDSSLYQQVVSVLQGTSTPLPEHTERISSLLKCHPDLQQELCEFFRQLQPESPSSNSNETAEKDCISQSPTGSDAQEEELEQAVCAQNISMDSKGEKRVIWTREADRAILTACQQHGATQKTFRQVSTKLGNKTARQVSLRFHDLMSLFHSAQKSNSGSSEGHQMDRQEAALD